MAQAKLTWINAVNAASLDVGSFVQRFYKLPFANTSRATVEPSEVGLSDLFMVRGREAGLSAPTKVDITMVNILFS
jgi:hypothetical protein